MIKVLAAYKALKHLAININTDIDDGVTIIEEMESDDIFQMFENKQCTTCGGSGERYVYSDSQYVCRKCRGNKIVTLACKYCKKGKFTLRNGRIVECRACKGSGLFTPICNLCYGTGTTTDGYSFWDNLRFYRKPQKEKVVTCPSCNGKGTIRVKINPFNPVIPKGAVL